MWEYGWGTTDEKINYIGSIRIKILQKKVSGGGANFYSSVGHITAVLTVAVGCHVGLGAVRIMTFNILNGKMKLNQIYLCHKKQNVT